MTDEESEKLLDQMKRDIMNDIDRDLFGGIQYLLDEAERERQERVRQKRRNKLRAISEKSKKSYK